jgi:uncharacterized membrane protein
MNATQNKTTGLTRTHSALLLVLVLGFVLRLPGLTRELWLDEAISLFHARGADYMAAVFPNGPEFTSDIFTHDGGWRGSLQAIGHIDYTPPLYYFLLRGWIKLFDEDNQTLRLLSVGFGIATIVAIFLLGRKVFDETTGLAAAGLLAFLPLHIQFSQEVRAYALSILLATLGSWAFWNAYQAVGQRGEWRRWFLYTVLAAASLYAHYFTVWVIIAHGLFALVQPRAVRLALVKRLALVAAGIVLLMAPWITSAYFRSQVNLLRFPRYELAFWEWETLMRIPALVFYFFAGYLPAVRFKSPFGAMLLGFYAIGALAVIRAVGALEKPALLFAALMLFMPLVAVSGTAAVLNKAGLITQPRFVLCAVIGLCLLFGTVIVSSRQRRLSLLVIGLALVTCLNFQVKWYQMNSDSSTQWWLHSDVSPAVVEVNRKIKTGELILFDDEALLVTWNAYEKGRQPQLLMARKGLSINQPMDFDSKWQEVKNKYAGIYIARRAAEPPTEVIERLETSYQLVSRERIGTLEVRHYVRP